MKSKLSKPLRKYFQKRLRQELPQFQDAKSKEIPSGYRVYKWSISHNLTFFIVLAISPKTDEFTFEGHICTHGGFLAENDGEPYDELKSGELRFDLTRLWVNSIDAFWWHIGRKYPLDKNSGLEMLLEQTADISTKKIIPPVEDAIKHIKQYALPYFKKMAQKLGHEFDL